MNRLSLIAILVIMTFGIIFALETPFNEQADAAARGAAAWFHNSETVLAAVYGIGLLASKKGIISLLAIAIILLGILYKKILQPLMLVLAVYLGDLLNKALKEFFGRERPLEPLHFEEGFSFPSGHAMVGVIFYGFFIYLIAGKLSSASARMGLYGAVCLLMLLIGMNRIVMNAHFLSDVAGGYFIGLICLTMVISIYEKINPLRTEAGNHKSSVSV
ncbi:phosphatase PAP2 family protein [Metabacillus idriensis]|uniref:phosphatase PAP2 family protein n=1 Tax=Metabacillus idriensis TaxID=324768 RepID=UPI00163A672C|nr:phosphatase PAP2 family protein [Metabacillus idriensis]QNG59726.1 phosphatase PAP2 family protein [Bacillus sp. PAMC26568]